MPPLTRSPTTQSIHSWWSDSKPLGPTISIHAAAKPLMRLLYHGQVRSFIKRNCGTRLSKTTMDTCLSYLAFKYLSPATKTLILKELNIRVASKDDVRVVVESVALDWDIFAGLLHSSDSRVRQHTCYLLGNLASQESTVWGLDVCLRIVSLVSDGITEVRESALYAITRIIDCPDGTQANLDTDIWQHFLKLLDAEDSRIRQVAYNIVGKVATFKVASLILLGSKLCIQLSDQDIEVRRRAIYTLSQMSFWPGGAQAAVDARTIEHIPDLLNSPDGDTRKWTCETVGNLVFYGATSIAQLGPELCARVVSLLSDDSANVQECALYSLVNISHPTDGADVVRKTKIWEYLSGLLESSDPRIFRFTCQILGNLAAEDSMSLACLGFWPYFRIVSLLRYFRSLSPLEMLSPRFQNGDNYVKVQRYAIYALSKMSDCPDGAHAAVATKMHQYLPDLLDSSDGETRRWTCEIIGNIGLHVSTPGGQLCSHVVSLLSDEDSNVRDSAILALLKISRCSDGARVVGNTSILEYASKLLDFDDSRSLTCETLGNLSFYKVLPGLGDALQMRVISLLRDPDDDVCESAMFALHSAVQQQLTVPAPECSTHH